MRWRARTARRGSAATPGPLLPSPDVAARPGDARTARLIGEALEELGDVAEAIHWLREADALAPDDARTLYRLGRLLVRTGEREQGERLLARVAELAAPPPVLDEDGRREQRRRER